MPCRRQFTPGFIFGKKAIMEEAAWGDKYSRDRADEEQKLGVGMWKVRNTPITNYLHPLYHKEGSFEILLYERLGQAISKREKFRLLDIGVGTGNQWLDFFQLIPEPALRRNFELSVTSFARTGVADEFQRQLVLTEASGLHKHFEPDYFDMVVAHWGAHCQELIGFENAVYLAKSRGEILFAGDDHQVPYGIFGNAGEHHEIISTHDAVKSAGWGIYARKK
jgi:hypothetical protein